MVYVISQDNKPLMPCSNPIARLLLKCVFKLNSKIVKNREYAYNILPKLYMKLIFYLYNQHTYFILKKSAYTIPPYSQFRPHSAHILVLQVLL